MGRHGAATLAVAWTCVLLFVALPVRAAVPPLLEPERLARLLGRAAVLDVRMDRGEMLDSVDPDGHVPGAVPVPVELLRDARTEDGDVRFAPPPGRFAALLRRLGVDAGEPVVVAWPGTRYRDLQGATWLVWLFALYGHDAVALLDRGNAGWRRAGLPVETAWRMPAEGGFAVTRVRERLRATTAEVERIVREGGAVLVDARDPAVYRGERPAPGTGARGHLPGAVNLPGASLLVVDRDGDLHFRPPGELRERVAAAGLRRDVRIVVYCDGGREAAVVWFVLARPLGFPDVALYEGSLFAWTADPARARMLVRGAEPGGPEVVRGLDGTPSAVQRSFR
ncbi:Putative thiosulfate sulfurtransferase [bacterium HR39]|nr:Putative thiosulfate sulfurtransferase [bacterium HR39]